MARQQHDRENLLQDAVAFVHRAQWCDVDDKEVFVGFRSTGAVSVYLDQDPVYHFNSAGLLRRAYIDDCLIKASVGQLVTMHRQRPGGEVQLVSRQMDATSTAELLQNVFSDLQHLFSELKNGRLRFVGRVPAEADVIALAIEWLVKTCAQPIGIADSPHAT